MPRRLKETPHIESIDSCELGSRIAATRRKRGITQTGLASLIGIDQRLISSYEVGRVTLSAEMLTRIAVALQVSTDELLGLKAGDIVEAPTVRLVKRLQKIKRLPPAQQKALLKNIDMFLKAAEADSAAL